MKRIFNDEISPYLTLPNGVTVTLGGSMVVLNEDILEDPKIKKFQEQKKIRIEEESESTGGDRA